MPFVEAQQNNEKPTRFEFFGNLELGRQRSGDPPPFQLVQASSLGVANRLIIAPLADSTFSRSQMLLESLGKNNFRLTNVSKKTCHLDLDTVLAAGESCEKSAPFSFGLQNKLFRIIGDGGSSPLDEVDVIQSLVDITVGGQRMGQSIMEQSDRLARVSESDFSEVVSWLQMTMQVLSSTVGSQDFLQQAAVALVDIVGLESGRVLLFGPGRETIAAAHPPEAAKDLDWRANPKIINRLLGEKKTVWYTGHCDPGKTNLGAMAVVAAPLLDSNRNLLGALYGERTAKEIALRTGTLEALMVDMLACGIATGISRQKYEKEAVAARVQFEQFFTPELARQLAKEPDLLRGREAEVTILFCDVRGFSRISERVGPEGTNKVMSSIFDELSECVHGENGVLVDFLGDGMLAMWGVPGYQPDHARRCVLAARKMQGKMAGLSERWRRQIGESLAIGIGINSGKAWVGNTGSSIKFKYGPLGPSVNLASRVEGLTKFLQCAILITGGTKKFLDGEFQTRRVVKARVANVQEPVDIYQVFGTENPKDKELASVTEEALRELERTEFGSAAKIAGIGLGSFSKDTPLLLILNRAVQEMINPSEPFDNIWTPPGK